jgi:hypothetical protein
MKVAMLCDIAKCSAYVKFLWNLSPPSSGSKVRRLSKQLDKAAFILCCAGGCYGRCLIPVATDRREFQVPLFSRCCENFSSM